jgi:hypothetical protein
MQILEQIEVKLNWTDFNSLHVHPYPTHKRSNGIHVSDILRKVAIKTQVLKVSEIEEEFAPLRVFLGLAWEQQCVRLYKDIAWQPGELHRDGIAGSPDGESQYYHNDTYEEDGSDDVPETLIEEFKYTAKSCRIPGSGPDTVRDITQDWLWRNQVLAYMAMHPVKPTLVRWHICFCNGNYTYPMTEKYIRYLVRATQQEIDNCWAMIKKNKYLL